MRRLTAKMVRSGLVTAWRFAGWPTSRSPSSLNATIEGVVRMPSAFSITFGVLPSITATHEFVVPRPMPMTLPMVLTSSLYCGRSAGSCSAPGRENPHHWRPPADPPNAMPPSAASLAHIGGQLFPARHAFTDSRAAPALASNDTSDTPTVAYFCPPSGAKIGSMRCPARLLLVLAILLNATAVRSADVDYPPGSRLGMVPPSGMVISKNFVGYEDANHNAAIILASLPPDAYSELDKTVTAEALRRQGVRLDRREPLSLPSGKAFLVTARQEVDKTKFRKWILIGSAPGLTALVTVQIPENATTVYPDSAIRAALATLAVRASVPTEEQLGLLPFRIG